MVIFIRVITRGNGTLAEKNLSNDQFVIYSDKKGTLARVAVNKQTNNKVKFSLIPKKIKPKKLNNDPKNKPTTNEVIKPTTKLKTTYIK